MSKTKALWPLIIQEAYSELRKKYYENFLMNTLTKSTLKWAESITKKKAKEILKSGCEGLAYVIITGQPSGSVWFNANFNQIITTLSKKANSSSTCSFRMYTRVKDVETGGKVGLHTRHAYAIVGIDTNKQTITLQDPNRIWGAKGRHGQFTMSFRDFQKYAVSIDYSIKPTPQNR